MGKKGGGREGRKESKHGTVFKDNWHPNEGFNQGRCPHGIWGTRDSSQHRGGWGIQGDCYASIRSTRQPVQTEQKDGDLRGKDIVLANCLIGLTLRKSLEWLEVH